MVLIILNNKELNVILKWFKLILNNEGVQCFMG